MSMTNPLTPAGIEPATYRFVAQYLNHSATAVPVLYKMLGKFIFCAVLLKRSSTIVIRKCDVESYVTVELEGYALLQMAIRIIGTSNSRSLLKPSGRYMYHQFNIQ